MMIRPSFRPLILLLYQLSLPPLVLAAESVTTPPDVEWERTVKAAEQEGQVNVYKIASDSEWQAFQKKYPKIKVNLLHATAAQHLQRIMAERRAGKYLVDVIRLGGGTSTSLYKAKAIDPLPPALMLPEVKDQAKWFEGRHQYNDVENQYVFIYAAFPLHLLGYNPKIVEAQNLRGYTDLLDPKWKGKITVKDPRDPGGASPLLFLHNNPQLGPEFIKKLFTLAGLTLIRNEGQQLDWIAWLDHKPVSMSGILHHEDTKSTKKENYFPELCVLRVFVVNNPIPNLAPIAFFAANSPHPLLRPRTIGTA